MDQDFIERLNAAPARRQRLMHAIEVASREAKEATYGMQSPDGSIRMAMNGSFRIEGMAINPDIYEQMTADDLADRVIATYNLTRQMVRGQQLARVLNPLQTQQNGSDHG